MSILRSGMMAAALTLAMAGIASAEVLRFDLAKTQSCGCCVAYVKRLEARGHVVEARNLPMATLIEMKVASGIPPEMTSCHTSKVAGYTIEGHVPVEDIERLIAEAPDAIGLAVPGMPVGSPGMEYGDSRDAYDVFLIKKDGTTSVFQSYAAVE
ncbi:DUF411 domain-containing protein [Mesorhizobium sp. VNQ89]|uniref:DUF411 domain-containing protein n=1 Tax=Mesorhizobium quangtriensis TaxID=3157709 RepID=UPI0032B814DE